MSAGSPDRQTRVVRSHLAHRRPLEKKKKKKKTMTSAGPLQSRRQHQRLIPRPHGDDRPFFSLRFSSPRAARTVVSRACRSARDTATRLIGRQVSSPFCGQNRDPGLDRSPVSAPGETRGLLSDPVADSPLLGSPREKKKKNVVSGESRRLGLGSSVDLEDIAARRAQPCRPVP